LSKPLEVQRNLLRQDSQKRLDRKGKEGVVKSRNPPYFPHSVVIVIRFFLVGKLARLESLGFLL
jgi:hypothetical protein